MCLSQAFNKFKAQWSLLETRSIPSPSPRSYNPNVHCQYHQGASYHTVTSITLRYVTEEIIAQKWINHSTYFNDQLQYSIPSQYLFWATIPHSTFVSRNSYVILEHKEIVFISLTFMMDPIINLMSRLYHEYEKREHHSPYSDSI